MSHLPQGGSNLPPRVAWLYSIFYSWLIAPRFIYQSFMCNSVINGFVNFSLPVLAASGKLDKKALPPIPGRKQPKIPDSQIESDQKSHPASETEKFLEATWCEILQLEFIDVEESFFELGGWEVLLTFNGDRCWKEQIQNTIDSLCCWHAYFHVFNFNLISVKMSRISQMFSIFSL